MIMILVMIPFFLFAMYERHGQPLEKVVQDIIETKFTRPKVRPYQTDNLYAVTEQQAKLYKEVKTIADDKTAAKGAKARNR